MTIINQCIIEGRHSLVGDMWSDFPLCQTPQGQLVPTCSQMDRMSSGNAWLGKRLSQSSSYPPVWESAWCHPGDIWSCRKHLVFSTPKFWHVPEKRVAIQLSLPLGSAAKQVSYNVGKGYHSWLPLWRCWPFSWDLDSMMERRLRSKDAEMLSSFMFLYSDLCSAFC